MGTIVKGCEWSLSVWNCYNGRTHNRSVLGSSPSGSTIKIKLLQIFTVRAFLWSGVLTNAARDSEQFSARFYTPLTCVFYYWHIVCKEPGENFLRALCISLVGTLCLFKIPLPGFLLWNKPVLSTLGFKEPNPLVQLLCLTDIEPFG